MVFLSLRNQLARRDTFQLRLLSLNEVMRLSHNIMDISLGCFHQIPGLQTMEILFTGSRCLVQLVLLRWHPSVVPSIPNTNFPNPNQALT